MCTCLCCPGGPPYTDVSRKVVSQKLKSERNNVESYYMIEAQGISAFREGNSTNTCTQAFPFLLAKDREPQPSDAKLSQPIIPIGIVAYSFTLLWDNLCRNNCRLKLQQCSW